MKDLYQLAKQNDKHRAILETLIPQSEASPLRKLNHIVFSSKSLSEEACMLELYGRRNLTAFSRLKSRLKDLMYLTLILQTNTVNEMDLVQSQPLNYLSNSLVGKLLIAKKSFDLGLELLEKTIAKSIKYNYTENVLISSRILLSAYGGIRYNKYKFIKYSQIQDKYLNIYSWELKAESYFFDLQKYQLQSLANPNNELVTKSKFYIKEIEKAKNIGTPNFYFNKFRILGIYYEYTKDYEGLLKISNQAIKEFTSVSNKSSVVVPNIYIRKIWALIQSGKSDEAIIFGKGIMPKVLNGSPSWFRLGYYTLKGYLYNQEYKKAVEMFNTMYRHQNYKKLEYFYIELFNTTLGYMHLITNSGIIENTKEMKKILPDFKLGKFLNTTPLYSKDKRGINVSILLMHIVFLLQRKDFNAIIDRTDSLNQYAYRYLRRMIPSGAIA